MQKLHLYQNLSQKLSPQQIQLIRLLQLPADELVERIEEELQENIALEKVSDSEEYSPSENADAPEEENSYEPEFSDSQDEAEFQEPESVQYEISLAEYPHIEELIGYKMEGDGSIIQEDYEKPIAAGSNLYDSLLEQLSFLNLSEKHYAIGKYLIGSIEDDGYIRRPLENLVNDLAFYQGIETTLAEVEEVLSRIQTFDPPGIAARNLQECLLIQLRTRDQSLPAVKNAQVIIKDFFEEFTKKHYSKITRKISLSNEELREAISLITKLNPKPGGSVSGVKEPPQTITPDFFIVKTEDGKLEVRLNTTNEPELRINPTMLEILDTYDKSKKKNKKLREQAIYCKQKIDAAKWFIEAIKQRHETLLKTMNAILEHQYEFFMTEDQTKLKPMILKDIAQKIGMDISTVSRVASSKTVQTPTSIYPLKFFFSEGIATNSGEDASSKEVKQVLKEIIDAEDKTKPLSDDKLEAMLKEKGYNLARRTVAKYREQLGIPVARLRKEA